MMARVSTLGVLIIVLLQQQTLATRRIINEGDEYRQACPLTVSRDSDRYIIQFYIDKTEVQVFHTRRYSDHLRLVSNGTTIVPYVANHTDRYSVKEGYRRHTLIIKNVTELDSAWYGCRTLDLETNEVIEMVPSTELLVPGRFGGVLWTSNYTGLSLDVARQHELYDGEVVLTDNAWYGPNIACAVLVSNMEPTVKITIGRLGEPGSVDITHQFEIRSSPMLPPYPRGTLYRETVFFVKKQKFVKTSLRDVYCRASLLGTTHEKSVNIQVPSRPKNKGCFPLSTPTWLGRKNVTLFCLIEAHPEPYVEWILPGGRKINALSNNPNYKVTNLAIFEGLFTTLTISEVTEDKNIFGRLDINATNTEGTGLHYLYLRQGTIVSAAGITRSSAVLITMMTCLLSWMLK